MQLGLLLVVFLFAAPYLFGLLSGNDSSTGSNGSAPTSEAWPTELIPGVPAASPTRTSDPAASGATTRPGGSATRPSPATTGYPRVVITGQECGRSGTGPYAAFAAGNSRTSCAFAKAVQAAYLRDGDPGLTSVVTGYSQARRADIRMRRGGGAPVRCDSGDGATVYLHGGEAVLR